MTEQPPPDDQNPFRGTPFEQFFAGGTPDISQLFSQLQSMMQPYDGPLNWELATDTARKSVAQQPDPTPSQKQRDEIADAVRLADHWLDETTNFPSGVTSTAAWSRAEWVVGTTDVWKILVEPIAASSVGALGNALPAEAASMGGPILAMLGKAVGAMLADPGGFGSRRDGRRGGLAPPTSASRWELPARRHSCRPTSRASPRGSTYPRATCCSTSRSARRPTSGSSPRCRGCATT